MAAQLVEDLILHFETKAPDADCETKQPDIDDDVFVAIPKPDPQLIAKLPEHVKALHAHKAGWKINDDGSLTFFPTPDCEPGDLQKELARDRRKRLTPSKMTMESILRKQKCHEKAVCISDDALVVEERMNYDGTIPNSFITSALRAWNKHYPFRFRPEHIWLLIVQGVSCHVEANAEKLRSKFVTHEAKRTLEVDLPAQPTRSEWVAAIDEFAKQIDANTVDDTTKLMACDFSSTTPNERVAAKVALMDVCKNYFHFMAQTSCGFPAVTLDGTKADWLRLKQKAQRLLKEKVTPQFGARWGAALLPLLDRFIGAFDGDIDGAFWNSMIKKGGGSGEPDFYSGWVNILFPLCNGKLNDFCVPFELSRDYVIARHGYCRHFDEDGFRGPTVDGFSTGVCVAPVRWNRLGKQLELKFLSGFAGYTQNTETHEICPNVGWCVAFQKSETELAEEAKAGRRGWW